MIVRKAYAPGRRVSPIVARFRPDRPVHMLRFLPNVRRGAAEGPLGCK
jgi:hypothetical protein